MEEIRKSAEKEEKADKVGGNPVPVLSTIRFGGKIAETPNIVDKKPILNINLTKKHALEQNTPGTKPTQNNVKIIDSKKPIHRKTIHTDAKIHIQPNKRRNFTMKRKFTSKNIMINIENLDQIKKSRKAIEEKVRNMSEQEITTNLIKKGLLRPNANPPRSWKENTLIDIMMFPVRL
jgi:hypothetical protein